MSKVIVYKPCGELSLWNRIGSPSIFCNFAKIPYFWGCFLLFSWATKNTFSVKVAQIYYVSKNQLHCTANLNFDFMCKKAKHGWALSTNFLFLFIWYFFLIMFSFMLNRQNSNSSKYVAVWRCDSMKQNFGRFIFTL